MSTRPPASPPAAVRCAVIGQPIAHSKSPALHAAFAAQTGLSLDYQRIEAGPEAFGDTVQAFFAAGGRGLNVTLPHKGAAFALAGQVSARARLAQAANTLWRDADGQLCADNTDGIGLVRDLARLGIALAGARVLVLGAGGATAGILGPLLEAGVQTLQLTNRTRVKAEQLVAAVADPRLSVHSHARDFDLVISAVADGVADLLPAGVFSSGARAYDLNYGARAEAFLQLARTGGASAVYDGYGMLIEQAAESFRIWHGVLPDTAPLHQRRAG